MSCTISVAKFDRTIISLLSLSVQWCSVTCITDLARSGSACHQMGQIWNFLRSDFSISRTEMLYITEIWCQKVPALSHLMTIWPSLGPNATPHALWNELLRLAVPDTDVWASGLQGGQQAVFMSLVHQIWQQLLNHQRTQQPHSLGDNLTCIQF